MADHPHIEVLRTAGLDEAAELLERFNRETGHRESPPAQSPEERDSAAIREALARDLPGRFQS